MHHAKDTAPSVPFLSRIPPLPFYYGWIILLAGSIGVLASIPGQTMGVSVFTDHLMEALGLSRVGISSAYMAGTLISSLIIPYAGVLFDRYGARIVAAFASLFLSGFLFLLAYALPVSQALSSLGLPMGMATLAVTILGFLGIRFFGQGVLTLVSRGMVAKWFGPRRGLAVGLMGIITAFGFSYAPQPLQMLINGWGWQQALISLAFILLFLFFPFVLLIFRAEPTTCGLEVEQGMKRISSAKAQKVPDAKVEKDLKQARKDRAFYLILASLGFWSLFNTAFTFHITSLYQEVGFDANQAVRIFLPISVVSVLARFLGSYLTDRVGMKSIYAGFIASLVVASISLLFLGSPLGDLLAILGFGIGGGLFGMLNILTWPKLYGRKHLGQISGFAMSVIVAGSAIGPWIFSVIHRFFGSYKGTGILGLLWCALMIIMLVLTPFPSAEKEMEQS